MAEVARVDDDLDVVVDGGDLFEDGDGVVGGVVVDEDVLVLVLADADHDLADLAVHLGDVVFLVVARSHDADRLQK